MKLTPEQQKDVERLIPYAATVARKFGRDDQLYSEAMLALCEAVATFDEAKGTPLHIWVGTKIKWKLLNYKRKRREMPVGLV